MLDLDGAEGLSNRDLDIVISDVIMASYTTGSTQYFRLRQKGDRADDTAVNFGSETFVHT